MMKLSKKIIVLTFSFLALILMGCQKASMDFEFPDYTIKGSNTKEEMVILDKDPGIVIDGNLIEKEWEIAESNKYSDRSSVSPDVTFETMCYLGEKGVYFGVVVNDFAIYYNEEKRPTRNSSVEVHVKGFGSLDTRAYCILIVPTGDGIRVDMNDSTRRLNLNGEGKMQWMSCPFKWEGAALVKGNINTSTCEGYVCEAFIPWESLGVDKCNYVRTCTAFNHVESDSSDGDRTWGGTTGCSINRPNTWKIASNEGLFVYEDIINDLVVADEYMTIDGELKEEQWQDVRSAEFTYLTKTGEIVEFSAKSYMTDTGSYFGFVVKDKYIYYADKSVRDIGLNSGMEILFAPLGSTEIDSSCLQLRITANNVKVCYTGVPDSYPWAVDPFDILTATTIQGKLNSSENEGFTIEIFIPWTSFGSNEKLDGVMICPSVTHTESPSLSQKISPWDYCNVTNANVAHQNNPSTDYICMKEDGVALNKIELKDIFVSDDMLNGEYYEGVFDVKAGFVDINIKSTSSKYNIKPQFELPVDVLIKDNEDGTFKIKIPKAQIESFKNGVEFKASCDGVSASANIYYSEISVDGDINDTKYGNEYQTITNVSKNIVLQTVKTNFGEKGIFVGFEVEDAYIKTNTHVETFFSIGEEIIVGNTWQIRVYPLSGACKTYIYAEPDDAGWAWEEKTGNNMLNVSYITVFTEKGYNVELFIPYATFNLKTAPEIINILPCVSYYKNNTDRGTSQYHNQKGVSNYFTHEEEAYVQFNKDGYVSNRIKVEDVYLTSNDIKGEFYVKELDFIDEFANEFLLNKIEDKFSAYFDKINDKFVLKLKLSDVENVLDKDIKAYDADNNEYIFNILLFEESTADIFIDYYNGQVIDKGKNFGNVPLDGTISIAKLQDKNQFISANPKFTTGIEGDANGAILTNFKTGSYTLINNCDFNKDFTISCWVYIPKDTTLSTGNSSYLFGTTTADNCQGGFRVTLRQTNDGYGLNVASSSSDALLTYTDNIETETWHNVVLVREGNYFLLYVDSYLISTTLIADDADFINETLSFGAYVGEKWDYHNGVIAYDNVMIFSKAIDSNGIAIIYKEKM